MTQTKVYVEERLQFLLAHLNEMTKHDVESLNRLYRNVRRIVKVNEEKEKVLNNILFTHYETMQKRLDLEILTEKLLPFVQEKGLSKSMLQMDEIFSLIHADVRFLDNQLSQLSDMKSDIKKVLNDDNKTTIGSGNMLNTTNKLDAFINQEVMKMAQARNHEVQTVSFGKERESGYKNDIYVSISCAQEHEVGTNCICNDILDQDKLADVEMDLVLAENIAYYVSGLLGGKEVQEW